MTLLDLLRRLKKKPALDLDKMFVPVIFANGEDDDLPGLDAAVSDRPVMFDEKIYMPSENIEVHHRKMAFSCGGLHFVDRSRNTEFSVGYQPRATLSCAAGGRHTRLSHCHLIFNAPVRP